MPRYIIEGYYTEEPQVVSDIVDASSLEEAEAKIIQARGGGYVGDGGCLLSERIAGLQEMACLSAGEIELHHQALIKAESSD